VRGAEAPGRDERLGNGAAQAVGRRRPMRATCAARIESRLSSMPPLATANTVSPSNGVCAGLICSSDAVVGHHGHALAFCRGQVRVAGNDTRVVLVPGCNRPNASRRDSPGVGSLKSIRPRRFQTLQFIIDLECPGPVGFAVRHDSRASEFTATSAPTMMPPPKTSDAEPKPPLMSPAIAPRRRRSSERELRPGAFQSAYAEVAIRRCRAPALVAPFPRSCSTAQG